MSKENKTVTIVGTRLGTICTHSYAHPLAVPGVGYDDNDPVVGR